MTEKTEYKHSVSCSTEMGKYKSHEVGNKNYGTGTSDTDGTNQKMGNITTIKFDDPKDAIKMLGNPELTAVIEKVRNISITDVARNVKLDVESTGFETPELPDDTPEDGQPNHPEKEEGKETWEVNCEKCGIMYERPYKPVDLKYRKKPYLCPVCFKEENPR